MKAAIACFFFLVLLSSFDSTAQLSIVNMSEVQFGKLPNESADPFVSFYDRATINYRWKSLKASATIENYTSPYDDRNYIDLSQLTLSYKSKKWEAKLGNFYETLGRGMLLRSFEIPGAILEDIGFRSRNYFHRDLLGGTVKYSANKWNVRLLYAGVLNNVLPPTFDREIRRSQNVSAISTEYKFYKNHKIGLNYMLLQGDGLKEQHLYSVIASGPISSAFNYYIEYSENTSGNNNFSMYAGLNGLIGPLNFNLEYKHYDNYIIGNGYNEPPALIKQHTYRVLNRSTHVTNPLDEQGYQLDLYFDVNENTSINFNHALAINDFSAITFTFQEYFIEWSSSLKEGVDYKIFVDYSEDPFKAEQNRISAGSYWDVKLGDHMRILPEIEYQQFNRGTRLVRNHSYSLGWQADEKLFLSILLEGTTDPFLINDAGDNQRWYVGSNFRYKPNFKNTFQLFLGERRGGPLCSAGVCYEILDFRGVELRWTTRF
jgi:hypothetical protein